MSDDAKQRVVALIDVTCRHCGRRFGFAHPAPEGVPHCPGCGRVHETTKLEELLAGIADFEDQIDLADEIAKRVSLGRTVAEISETTGVGQATLRSFLLNASPLPVELYRKACAALGVEP